MKIRFSIEKSQIFYRKKPDFLNSFQATLEFLQDFQVCWDDENTDFCPKASLVD